MFLAVRMLSDYWHLLACAAAALVVWKINSYRKNPRVNLPPGPKPWPVIGNLLDMPSTDARAKFTEWGKVHGEITVIYI